MTTGKKDTSISTNLRKFSPETTFKCLSSPESMTICTALCMPPTYSHLLESLSHFRIILSVSTSLKEWGSGILLNKPLEKISIPLKRPCGKLKVKPSQFPYTHLLINLTLPLEMDTALIWKPDFGRPKDMPEDSVMSPTLVHVSSENHSTGKHSGCRLLSLKFSSCPASSHGSSYRSLIRQKSFMYTPKHPHN